MQGCPGGAAGVALERRIGGLILSFEEKSIPLAIPIDWCMTFATVDPTWKVRCGKRRLPYGQVKARSNLLSSTIEFSSAL